MRLLFSLLMMFAVPSTAYGDGLDPGAVAEAVLAVLESEAEHGDNPEPGGDENPIEPDYNATAPLMTSCFGDEDCHTCMLEAISVSNDAYYTLARNHAWKKWASTEYDRMDALATAASGLNKHAKMAYALQKSKVIIPAKKSFEDNVKTAQTTTLNSLKSAFEKIGSCEAEHLGQDNFTNMSLLVWQILKVKYID